MPYSDPPVPFMQESSNPFKNPAIGPAASSEIVAGLPARAGAATTAAASAAATDTGTPRRLPVLLRRVTACLPIIQHPSLDSNSVLRCGRVRQSPIRSALSRLATSGNHLAHFSRYGNRTIRARCPFHHCSAAPRASRRWPQCGSCDRLRSKRGCCLNSSLASAVVRRDRSAGRIGTIGRVVQQARCVAEQIC